MSDIRKWMRLVEAESPIDPEIRNAFRYGWCMYLAEALASLTRWDIKVEVEWYNEDTQEDGGVDHAWVERPDGSQVDIDGVHPAGTLNGQGVILDHISIEDRFAGSDMDEAMPVAYQLIKSHPKHFGLS